MFEKIALVGIGLIGSSLARVIRRERLARHIAIATRSPETLARAEELGLGNSYSTDAGGSREGRRSGRRVGSGRVLRRGRRADRAGPEAWRHRHRCRFHEALGHRPDAAASARKCSLHSRPSARRYGEIRAGCRLRRPVRTPLVHFHTAAGHRPCGAGAAVRILAALRLEHRHDGRRASRHGARHRLASSAYHRLQHRGHCRRSGGGDEVRSDQIFGVRFPRLHASCRVRSHHVARRVPAQQGCDPRDAGALLGGSRFASACDPLGRRRESCSRCLRGPGRSAARSSRRARKSTRRTSAVRRSNILAPSRCRGSHSAIPGKVDTGFPSGNCARTKTTEVPPLIALPGTSPRKNGEKNAVMADFANRQRRKFQRRRVRPALLYTLAGRGCRQAGEGQSRRPK